MSNLPFIFPFCLLLPSLSFPLSHVGDPVTDMERFPGTVRIAEQLSGPFNLATVEGDSRILMGLFYQLVPALEGDKGKERETETVRGCVYMCVCVRWIALTPPSDSTGEVPCQTIQHRLLSLFLAGSLSRQFCPFPECFAHIFAIFLSFTSPEGCLNNIKIVN